MNSLQQKDKGVPSWVEKAPQTPLSEALNGKQYKHWVVCNVSYRKPLGSPGCICLRHLKEK